MVWLKHGGFLTCVFLLIVFRLRTILRNFGWRRVITTEEYTSSLQMVQILHKLAVVIFFLKAHTWSVGFCLLLFNKWLGVIISIFSINFVYFFFFVEIDLHKGSDENFVQEYIANPYLIDKRSCFIVYRKVNVTYMVFMTVLGESYLCTITWSVD